MNCSIVRPMSWGKLDSATWAHIIDNIAKGESFGIWHGRWCERPPTWVEGKCALRVKVGKKRKLVRGTLTLEYEGFDEGGETYSLVFTPTKPRILTKRLHSALYEHINDHKELT